MRGYVPSSLPSDGSYHVGAVMDDALRVLEAAGPTGRDVFIGHDWGAIAGAGLAAMPDSPFSKAVIMSVPLTAAFRPFGRLPHSAGWPRKLPRQLLHSWYIMYFQLPWLPDRSASWVIPRLWRQWSPGYRRGRRSALRRCRDRRTGTVACRARVLPRDRPRQQTAGPVRGAQQALAAGAAAADAVSPRHRRRLLGGLHAVDRAGVARRERGCADRERRALPATRPARRRRASHRRLHRTGQLTSRWDWAALLLIQPGMVAGDQSREEPPRQMVVEHRRNPVGRTGNDHTLTRSQAVDRGPGHPVGLLPQELRQRFLGLFVGNALASPKPCAPAPGTARLR